VVRCGQAQWGQAVKKLALASFVAASLVLVGPVAQARNTPQASAEPVVTLAELPPEARHTRQLIAQGGPFPYQKDGTVFFNRERLLPLHPRGWYREYTVKTPGARNRGARRIVCGGQEPTRPVNCYYTADHYASFRRIIE